MIGKVMRGLGVLLVGAGLLFGTGQPAVADISLSFDQLIDGGTLSYDGSLGPLVGVDIRFDTVIGVGTPANAGVTLFCYPTPCLLDLTSGANTLESGVLWTWDDGGSFVLTGGLNTAADGSGTQVVAAGSTLINGTFEGLVLGSLGSGAIITTLAGGTDTKDEDLAGFYGLGPDDWTFANTNITASAVVVDPVTFGWSAGVNEADITNFNLTVPAPATLMLIGSGLVAAWAARRRRK